MSTHSRDTETFDKHAKLADVVFLPSRKGSLEVIGGQDGGLVLVDGCVPAPLAQKFVELFESYEVER